MRRGWFFVMLVPVFFTLSVGNADARRKAPPPKVTVNKQSAAAISAMLGKFKFGMTSLQVQALILKDLQSSYVDRIRKASSEPLVQDRLRKELADEIAKVKKSFVRFTGKHGSWDSSIVEDQFKHSNDESMMVSITKEQNRFFFFHNRKLYKLFIAFNANHPRYKNLRQFSMFLQLLIQTFGQGKPAFDTDVAGQSRLHHVEWTGNDNNAMWAVDKTTLYGNFCLVIFNQPMATLVEDGRKANTSGTRPALDPSIKGVLKPRRDEE